VWRAAGGTYTSRRPRLHHLRLKSAELWIKGHKDMMDNKGYAQAVKTRGYFMALDKAFKQFLIEKSYSSDEVVTHDDLEGIIKK